MKDRIKYIWYTAFVILIFCAILYYFNFSTYTKNYSEAECIDGQLDLLQYDIDSDGIIDLSGQWNFEYNSFLKADETSSDAIIVDVPSTWNNYQIDGKPLDSFGYGTYRLDIKNYQSDDDTMAIYTGGAPSAYSIYIDDKLIIESGKVSDQKSGEVGDVSPHTAFFKVPGNEFSIIIHVSNYNFYKGGLWCKLYLGSNEDIIDYVVTTSNKGMLLYGILFAIATIYLVMCFFNNKYKRYISFSLICAFTAIVIDVDSNMLIMKVFSNNNITAYVWIGYLTSLWIPILTLLYVRDLFSIKLHKYVTYVALITASVSTVLILMLPTHLSSGSAQILNMYSGIILTYSMIIALLSYKKNKKIALLYFAGFSTIIVGFFHDYILLYACSIDIGIGNIFPQTMVIMMFFQTIVLSIDYNDMYKNREMAIKQAAGAELSFLQAQIKPHFLFNALSAIEDLCYEDPKKAGGVVTDLAFYLRSSFDFNSINKFTTLEKELIFIKNYYHIQKARFGDKVNYIENINVPLSITIPEFTLEPLVENAICHGITKKDVGGTVTLNVSYCGDKIAFSISDDGVGIEEETLDGLKNELHLASGVGLKNIDKRLTEIYGEAASLNIESEKNFGTTVSFYINNKEELIDD